MSESIDVAIATRDAGPMIDFYRDVLGLQVENEVRVSGVLPSATLTRLRSGSSVLKLLQFDEPPANDPPGGPIEGAAGLRYLTVRVESVGAVVDTCVRLNHPVVLERTELRPGVELAFVRDPDGTVVEVVTGA